MPEPDAYRKLADCVDVLRDVEGVEVEEAHVDEQPAADIGPEEMLMVVSGEIEESKIPMEPILHIVLSLDDSDPEYPEPPTEEELADNSDSGPSVENESIPDSVKK